MKPDTTWMDLVESCTAVNYDRWEPPHISPKEAQIIVEKDAELKRLREAVEWALSHGSLNVYKYSSQGNTAAQWSEDISTELRRRIGG